MFAVRWLDLEQCELVFGHVLVVLVISVFSSVRVYLGGYHGVEYIRAIPF